MQWWLLFISHIFYNADCKLASGIYKEKKRFCVAVAIILGFASSLSWFSSKAWWAEYDISPAEQKIIAALLWIIAVIILASRSTKKEKRRHFTQAVKRHVIRKQKGKCIMCKRKIRSLWIGSPS